MTGDAASFQDADLEYDPQDCVRLLTPILKGHADVVFGSCFTGSERKARRWADVPRQVAASMAFEGEPVDLEWLKTLHNRRTPRAS